MESTKQRSNGQLKVDYYFLKRAKVFVVTKIGLPGIIPKSLHRNNKNLAKSKSLLEFSENAEKQIQRKVDSYGT